MPHVSRTFRIFVSSTFDDMTAERNALQERVFPRLRALCRKHDARLQPIDLRWGVRDEAQLDQQTMRLCLLELARCQAATPQPNFVVLLGDRYGWRPPPAEIPAAELEAILTRISDPGERALLEQWYRRDDNALPPDYVLQPRDPAGPYAARTAWDPIEGRLHGILARAAAALGLPADRLLRYTASATHQEIAAGLLHIPESEQRHVFAFTRSLSGWPALPLPETDAVVRYLDGVFGPGEPGERQLIGRDAVAADQLAALRSQLAAILGPHFFTYAAEWVGSSATTSAPDAAPLTTGHLDRLCADAYDALSAEILAELARLEALDEESAVRAFADDRARNFVGRNDTLDHIAAYVHTGSRHPLVLWGESGTGKSAVMARVFQGMTKVNPSAEVICRFIGATAGSTDARTLLGTIERTINTTYELAAQGGTSWEDLVRDFPTRLAAATAEKPLIVMLDALDQLGDANDARRLGWLPETLPDSCRVIVSTTPGEALDALRGTLPAGQFVQLGALDSNEADQLLSLWLRDARRTLQPAQRAAVLAAFRRCPLPLYLKLAFEDARRWRSYDPPRTLAPDVPGLIADLYAQLSLPQAHGPLLVAGALGSLAAARVGLAEEEILGVLCEDDEFYTAFLHSAHFAVPGVPQLPAPPDRRLPAAVWARLYYDLEPYLTERDEEGAHVLAFYHRQLGEVAAATYLAEPGWTYAAPTPLTAAGKARHRLLADYFERAADPDPADADGFRTWSGGDRRALAELPYHLTMAEEWDRLYAVLTDFTFLEKKASTVGVEEQVDAEGETTRTVYNGPHLLQEDYRLALERFPGDDES